jgi:serine/threonine protein kinase
VKCADWGVQPRVAEARSSRAAPCSLPANTMEDYKVIRAIGKGSFGKVYLVRHVSEARQYVMKVIKLKGIPPKERRVRRPRR